MVAEGHLGPLSKAEFCQLSADIFKFYVGSKTRDLRTKNKKMAQSQNLIDWLAVNLSGTNGDILLQTSNCGL